MTNLFALSGWTAVVTGSVADIDHTDLVFTTVDRAFGHVGILGAT
jgi:hypothetical protein